MCTLYTFTGESKDQYLVQILLDAQFNSDGFSALIDKGGKFTLIRTESIDFLVDTLTGIEADRYFVHLRMATTAYTGVTRCHGLDAGDFTVFHNGVIDYAGDLDSRGIAELFAKHSLDFALTALKGFSYANVIAVNTQTGDYYINRSSVGSLYTDGRGNYSTTVIVGVCSIPVVVGQYDHISEPFEEYDERDWFDNTQDGSDWPGLSHWRFT